MAVSALTSSELLAIWERGDGQRPSRRALALLAGTAPHATPDELAAMPVGRRDASLVELRARLFGDAFTGVTSCPACSESIELTFGIDEVRREPAPHAPLSIREGPYSVELRVPTTADLAAIERETELDSARRALFARCVARATRGDDSIGADELPADVEEAAITAMANADPQADVMLPVDCPGCEQTWLEPFDIVSFLWAELSVLARRLLADVHTLAAAYGWSESDILSLSPARRNAYLEMLA